MCVGCCILVTVFIMPAKVFYSTLNDDNIHSKCIGKKQSIYKDVKLLMNNATFDTITLYNVNGSPSDYFLIVDDNGKITNVPLNNTMCKMGIKIYGNVVIAKSNSSGETVDLDIDLKEIKKLIKHTVKTLYTYLDPKNTTEDTKPTWTIISFI